MVKPAEIIDYSDPPPVTRKANRRSRYQDIIDHLKANPGKKAKVMENVNTASAKVFRTAGLKVEVRKTGDERRVDVWAVWEGKALKSDAKKPSPSERPPRVRRRDRGRPRRPGANPV